MRKPHYNLIFDVPSDFRSRCALQLPQSTPQPLYPISHCKLVAAAFSPRLYFPFLLWKAAAGAVGERGTAWAARGGVLSAELLTKQDRESHSTQGGEETTNWRPRKIAVAAVARFGSFQPSEARFTERCSISVIA